MKERKKEKNIGKNIRLSKIKKVKEKSAVIEKWLKRRLKKAIEKNLCKKVQTKKLLSLDFRF